MRTVAHATQGRHGRPCADHPRLLWRCRVSLLAKKDVDGRDSLLRRSSRFGCEGWKRDHDD
jgi:hypothetical protein